MNKSTYIYDEKTGVITRIGCHIEKHNGPVTGFLNRFGYLKCHYKGRGVFLHRLAWLLYYGEYPKSELDHINRDKTDNRIANLREVTRSQNCQNKDSSNAAGLRGVKKERKRFAARISVNGKYIHLGTFDTSELAHNAYRDAAIKFYGNNAMLENTGAGHG